MTLLDSFEQLAGGLHHPEGVVWNPFDGLVYAGGESGEIYSVSLEGEVKELGRTGGSMLGLAVDGRGRVYACDVGSGEIARFDPRPAPSSATPAGWTAPRWTRPTSARSVPTARCT